MIVVSLGNGQYRAKCGDIEALGLSHSDSIWNALYKMSNLGLI